MATNVKPESRTNTDVPMFLLKLVDLLQTSEYEQYVAWGKQGTSFIIKDQEAFSKIVLPHYFKHNKFSSFVRQLNLYGFRKVTSVSQGMLQTEEKNEFKHPFFIQSKPNILHLIKRKVSLAGGKQHSDEIAQVLEQVTEIKGNQCDITKALLDIRKENDELWSEVVSLRQKHSQQQKVVNHLIKFLVSLVQHHGMGKKRRLPIGWKDGDDADIATQSKMPRSSVNHSQSSSGELSPEGPLITELLSSSASPASVSADLLNTDGAISIPNNRDEVFDISQLTDLADSNNSLSVQQNIPNTASTLVEPTIYLNIPSNVNEQRSDASLPQSNAFHRSNSIHQDLNLNVDKIENNLNNIQNQLANSDQYQFDYDTIQDIFNGQDVPPLQETDWTTDLPKTIPLSQNTDNQLVKYTGDTPFFRLDTETHNEENHPDFDDLADLL